tara:strand:+ start:243 stop:863 length:621 start_codon:yes stop_codon:yes gene_type:complete
MPAFTSYANLQQNISDYLARQDLTAQIPMFISLAEKRLNRDLRLRQTLQQSTYSMDSGFKVPTPSDFLELQDIHLEANPIVPLTFQTVSQFYRRNGGSNAQGQPVNYTLVADNLILAPQPTGASTVNLTYYKIPKVLSDSNPSNEYLDVCPDLLLYASLAESAPYLLDDPRLATWQALYAEGLASITKSDQDSIYPAQPLAVQLTT